MKTAQEIFTIEEYSKKEFDYLDIINRIEEYGSQFLKRKQVEKLQEEAYNLGAKHERQQNCKHEIDYMDTCVSCGLIKLNQ